MSNDVEVIGRERTPAATPRGRAILAALDEQGLTLSAAAARCGLSFMALYRAIHGEPEKLTVRTVSLLCTHLGVSLSVVAPSLPRDRSSRRRSGR